MQYAPHPAPFDVSVERGVARNAISLLPTLHDDRGAGSSTERGGLVGPSESVGVRKGLFASHQEAEEPTCDTQTLTQLLAPWPPTRGFVGATLLRTEQPSGPRMTSERQRLRREASSYLQSCFALESPPHASELARQLRLSPSSFTKRFRLAVGIPPSEYLKGRQVARAKKLLTRTTMPVTKIGYCAAFHTRRTFFRVFRQFTGMSPEQYRNEQRSVASKKMTLAAATGLPPSCDPE